MDHSKLIERWFSQRGWEPFGFQKRTWQAYARGESGLVEAATGMGKTYAVWLGPLQEWYEAHEETGASPPIQVVWITPLRALAADTVRSLQAPVAEMGLSWTVELRTGDTSAGARKRQRDRLPTALVTTPESLSLLLSYPDTARQLQTVRAVIVDEWHELLGTKRGVQTELCLARLRTWISDLRIWGLSATLGNMEAARDVLLGCRPGSLVRGEAKRPIEVETLLPETMDRFPWAGHLGLSGVPAVVERLAQATTTLLFTNTRNQAERWFQALTLYMPEWETEIALHHGSLDRKEREAVERGIADRQLRCVVCTSSLDLGVDFAPVDQVIQIGSPRGVARLLQRAGRSGHQPDGVSRIWCVPTNSMELAEFAAARTAALAQDIEARTPLRNTLDVLAQHLVTISIGEGFEAEPMRREVMSTHAFADLSEEQWSGVLDFICFGGRALSAYPQYARVVETEGRFRIASNELARWHRMSIGTIASDATVQVSFLKGGPIGTVEEGFLARLKSGDTFLFAGKLLELVMVKEMRAYVRKAAGATGIVPKWVGGRMPLSSQLAKRVRAKFGEFARQEAYDPEMCTLAPLLDLQAEWSAVPTENDVLIERLQTRDGYHLFVFPFEGRVVNEAMAAMLAYRLTRLAPRTVTVSATDAGFELLSEEPFEGMLAPGAFDALFSADQVAEDLRSCMNAAELIRRQFRDIARISGLVFTGYPGSCKTGRQLQASSGLIFDVLTNYDPANLLLAQAEREALDNHFQVERLREALTRITDARHIITDPNRLTPFAFPIWAERVQAQISSEKWEDRVRKMAVQLENVASPRRQRR